MQRVLLSLLFVAQVSIPAHAGSRPVVSGDPNIDAQWIWQLRRGPDVCVTCRSIDTTGRVRARYRELIVFPDAAVRPRAVVTRRAAMPRRAPEPAAAPRVVDAAFLPAIVVYDTHEKPGTIVIDPRARYLYLVLKGGKAQRYGVGVGRQGFGWSGTVRIGRKAEWPTWTPPKEMRKRQPYLPVSVKGGPENPLGARALYLYRDGRDTMFRIHGSNEPWTIGRAVSSGCFRMRNEDVIALYARVGVGAKVVVL